MSANADDKQLITAVAAGERSALGELYDRFASQMLAVGIKMMGSRGAAEDVIHDVWLEVWERAGSYDAERGSVRTWLMVRMRSRCMDQLRRHQRRPKMRVADLCGDDELTEAPRGEQATERSRVREAIQSLPQRLSQVLMLSYFGGYSCSEIANEIDIPLGTVKSRLAAARDALESRLPRPPGGSRE